ncbi:DNA repair protein RecN [Alkalicoccus luteus]|uniref:DNA repair protein RecN n=1 Tax=Alkalicoccus luteus TaxID=1237094 RepID=UPI004034E4E6
MLLELTIRNFAIIEELTVSYEEGLTVLTGETGAGKSIIIDAIGLLIGGRGSVDFVRHGSKRAEIEGIFTVDGEAKELDHYLEDAGVPIEEGSIILRREITGAGKSICRINGKLTTLAVLRQIGQQLVDIHGQHEHQQLMQTDKHRMFLDRFAEENLAASLKEYREMYTRFQKKRTQLKALSENEQEMAQRLDLIRYQHEEITNAELKPREDEELAEEKQRLANSEGLYKTVHGSYEALYGEGKGLEWVMTAMNQLEEAAEMDPSLAELKETVTNNYYLLEEASFTMREYYDAIEFDPERLNEIEARLSEISQLKRKYGTSVEEILEYAASIEEELDNLTNKDERLHEWEKELEAAAEDLLVEASNMSSIRKKAAAGLEDAIHQQLVDLYMNDTVFQTSVTPRDPGSMAASALVKQHPFTEYGIDDVEFQVATNKGEPLKPLAKIASGGEISRMILALKSILAKHEGVTSLIFDEVDTGVSGRVAQAIAEKIHRIAEGSQVLCITHLPQVAAMADTHLYISKYGQDGRTITSVHPLTQEEQTEEIGRMISGVEVTEVTREHARELLEQASQKK